jgi:hypothetical protein
LEIDKSRQYEIIIFPDQDEGLKAQRILISKGLDFKHISTLAVVVPEEYKELACKAIIDKDVLVSGHYPFLYRDYEEDFFKRAKEYRIAESNSDFLKSITLCCALYG